MTALRDGVRRPALPACFLGLLLAGWVVPAGAAVELGFDAETLNRLLTASHPKPTPLRLPTGKPATLHVDELKVTGFDPAAGGGLGSVLTAIHIRIPELGVDMRIEPRLSLHFKTEQGRKTFYLKAQNVVVPLPVGGSLDIGPFLPSVTIPEVRDWTLDGKSLQTRLLDARMGTKSLRLTLDVDLDPGAPAPR